MERREISFYFLMALLYLPERFQSLLIEQPEISLLGGDGEKISERGIASNCDLLLDVEVAVRHPLVAQVVVHRNEPVNVSKQYLKTISSYGMCEPKY